MDLVLKHHRNLEEAADADVPSALALFVVLVLKHTQLPHPRLALSVSQRLPLPQSALKDGKSANFCIHLRRLSISDATFPY